MTETPAPAVLDPFDVALGERMRARRRELRISQTKLGDALGVTFQQVQKYERGVNRLSSAALVIVAEMLAMSPADLLGTGQAPRDGEAVTLSHQLLFDTHDGDRMARIYIELSPADRALVLQYAERLTGVPAQAAA